ncbi:MAG: threonine-phosphate decarboxylase CobD [Rhizobiaceae bacterium]
MVFKVLHGGALDEAIAIFGGNADEWLDLSTGINPVPYPIHSLPDSVWHRLPDQQAIVSLNTAARNYYNVSDRCEIVCANGTQSLIELLPRLLDVRQIDIVSPTYAEHAHVWEKAGKSVFRISSTDEISENADIAVVVNPNNPDCRIHDHNQLIKLASRVSCLLVDEAFVDPVPHCSILPDMPDNAIVLKSFGKFFGLAGVRLGFAICKPGWAHGLQNLMGPWSVSGPALTLGSKALTDDEWINKTRRGLEKKSAHMAEILEEAGLTIKGINPLFVFVQHCDAAGLARNLSKNHILVRAFPDQPGFLRFGLCRNEIDVKRLQKALKETVNV